MNDLYEWVRVLSQDREREARLNAETAHLIREALAARENDKPFYSEALVALGRQLSNWGDGLQERYGHLAEMPTDVPLEHARHEQC